ncbi:MAG: hypothetical protein JSS14_26425 [Proteobacteria bacterium]|nr:hypothetical protein [Pseudomonadota bacterium]
MGLVLAATVVAGCGKISAALTPATERITQAFPVSDELSLSISRYLESQKQEGRQAQAAEQVERLLKVRALTCTAAVSVARFDTPQDIRNKPVDPQCLRQQDEDLGEWIGMQRLAALVARPALVPLAPLGAPRLVPASDDLATSIVTSASANVAAIHSNRGIYTVIRLPDGKALQTFKGLGSNRNAVSLSPNGRVLLAQGESSRGLKAFDVETGTQVWSTDKYRQLIAWLPGVNALVAIRNEPQGGAALLDLATGRAAPYAIAQRHPNWALAVPGGSERQLVGAGQSAALVDHLREADGTLAVVPVGQWNLERPVSSGTPFLMGNGTKAVYLSHPGLGWLALPSGEQGFWDLGPLRSNGYAKVGESRILLATPDPASAYRNVGQVIDIDAATVAPATDFRHGDGMVVSLAPRTGYMRRGNTVSIGAEVQTGEAQDLQQVLAAANLEAQLAKLRKAQEEQAQLAKLRKAQEEQAQLAPMLASVPANAQVDVIGVYEGASATRAPAGTRAAATVRVAVAPSSAPLVLVLSSYEPVRWVVDNPSGRKISAVLLSGYHESSVSGAPGVQVLRIGSDYAYRMEGREYASLKKSVARYVANPVRTFQGAYRGENFMVGAN